MDDSKLIIQSFFDRLNAGDITAAAALMTDDSVHHLSAIGAGDQIGVANWLRCEESMRSAFRDRSFKVYQIIAEGDRAAARLTWRGTHSGEYAETAPTGKMVEVDALSLFRVEGDKIVEQWIEQDILGLYKQIGAVKGAWENWPD
jgi:steroid delta-isomerase-like uncharacterized protein